LKIYFNLDEIGTAFEKGSVVTLGNFDGIHLAHRSLIESLLNVSQNLNLPPILVTYYPNPSLVLGKNKDLKYIYSEEKKMGILRSLGLTNVLVFPFTKELSEISAYSFIQEILHGKLHAKHILLGFNHFFGKNREGDYDFLQKYKDEFSYTVDKIEPVYADGEKISSSYLRSLILDGEVEKVKSLLGMPFSIQGKVVHGEKRGRTIGFPTANLSIDPSQMLPGTGVYGGTVLLKSIPKKAMMNIGFRPTFEGVEKSIEVHILDFEGDLYDTSLEFIFLKKIRNEIKFSNLEELKSQLKKDQIFTQNLILPI
jgi:riboflavin kinase / FMN adenylyltransferase